MGGVKSLRRFRTKEEADMKYVRDELTRAYRTVMKSDSLDNFVLAWGDFKNGEKRVSFRAGFPDDLTRCLGMLERAKLKIIREVDGG